VGFRPAVSRFAAALALGGFVRNDEGGVFIEVEGGAPAVARFVEGLRQAAPALARIDSLETEPLVPLGEEEFRIDASDAVGIPASPASIPADLAPCPACLRELDDPADRRYRYPFINCTACGPRFTIVREVPYDRPRTTMAPFALCHACRREYQDPADRRFHAEASACPACGPTLSFVAPGAPDRVGEAALSAAARALASGLVVAVKGCGGFLLAADAGNRDAVARLRARKRRPAKPFAVMARSVEALDRIAMLDEPTRAVIMSRARPIVIVRARPRNGIAPNVAPGLPELGVFVPSTPLQQLLFDGAPPFLVMTSGNLSEEPIARANDEALARLAGVADAFLMHDREIHTRADDSVVRIVAGAPAPVRRARGYVPDPIALPFAGPRDVAILAVGAEQKATICLARGEEAILSQHLGDLDDADSFAFFEETVTKLAELAGAEPRALAHDLHPDYRSSRWAARRALADDIPRERVQHHHAHVAACMVEHGRTAPVLGVAFDGTGLGSDGELWGGELLVADLGAFRRVGHLGALPLLGGEAAIRAPWRLAAAALLEAGERLDLPALDAIPGAQVEAVRRLWGWKLGPRATGAGRWFDAVSALCGLRTEVSYEGQAAVELEAAAADGDHGLYTLAFHEEPTRPFVVDLLPTVRAIAADLRWGTEIAVIAARFHHTLARAIVDACRRARAAGAPGTVVLSGGCFQNRRLSELAKDGLERAGFEVLLPRRVPCNDGGIALGQAAVAAFRMAAAQGRAAGAVTPCA
jgi:hydrogenase maturation protein HypF